MSASKPGRPRGRPPSIISRSRLQRKGPASGPFRVYYNPSSFAMLLAMRRASSLVGALTNCDQGRMTASCFALVLSPRSLAVGRLINMRKLIIGIIGAVVLLVAGLASNAEAARLTGCCHIGGMQFCGSPPCPAPASRPSSCCKQYGTWHCPCPPKQ